MNVEANGHQFAYIRRGQGEPLLLIQGMSGHHDMWGDWFLELLEPHFDVVAYSHRGISTSSRADAPFTIADLADDAAGIITASGWQRAHILGISLGGMVAQELALRHADSVQTLTIGCSWAGGPSVALAETARRMVDAMATRDVEHALKTGYEANLSPRFAADPTNFSRYAKLSLSQRVPVPVVLMQWDAAQNHSAYARLANISAPTLVIHGTADACMPHRNGEHIASLIPGSRLELLPGVGHLFWWEQPQRTADLLLSHTLQNSS
ncbi:pimeloyl-ACP methyl ester carboxylesterase [Kibdelosporangium banguiense]|uniref:Pimeloyl-ACP methyl ester carboxylesterase n=1 Tax=Kibdelosporangium banguiense TaxID=1365924 RepID=A0ABS4TIW1_9PSEU|nr:alpha/beta fold hydrolase [Kibdelosporangium banguiense]MBP2324357.1 pimeloyl-ACP methyl ester carboxylesterase [Kibdelosporangium banguiense]